ncbi:hypothetical protein ACJRPK_13810 [Aquimarina sp. 2-A2]|uniref:hypothetical protein n=1 Tax=Aquimarina sp. 2-A2 TaxID=3382644 RepID=UPI00387F04DF
MSSIQDQIDDLKGIIADGRTGSELDVVQNLQNNDPIIIFSKTQNKLVSVEYARFLELVGSAGLVFEEEMDTQNPPQPTGFTLIKQAGITKFKIGKAGKSNSYADLEGLPSFAEISYVDTAFATANDIAEGLVDDNRAYYDQFTYKEGAANDLTGYIVDSDFAVTKTINGQYYLIKDINVTDTLEGSRTYFLKSDQFFNHSTPDIVTATFKAWNIGLTNPTENPNYKVYSQDAQNNVVDTGVYKFDLWIRKADSVTGRFVEIDGYWVDKRTNTNKQAIQMGDKIEGDYNGTDRHIVANVKALPYTIETNLEILVDGRAFT